MIDPKELPLTEEEKWQAVVALLRGLRDGLNAIAGSVPMGASKMKPVLILFDECIATLEE